MRRTDAEDAAALAAHVAEGLRRLQHLTEDERRAVLDEVRGSLRADDLDLDPSDTEVVLAVARGDLAAEAPLDLQPLPPKK